MLSFKSRFIRRKGTADITKRQHRSRSIDMCLSYVEMLT